MADDYATIICLYSKSVEMVEDVRGNVFTPPALTSGIHHAEQVLQFVSQVTGIAITDEDRHYMITGSQATEAGGPIKDQAGKNDRLICMHLGCAQTSIHGWKWFYSKRAHHQKLWPIDHYIGLAELLIKNEPRLRFVITGTKNETFLGKQFAKRIPGTINLIGKTSVTQLFDLMHGIDLFISQDCGVFHVAVASDVSILGLFGPTNPLNTGPYPHKKNHRLIKKDAMSEIAIEEAASAAIEMLRDFPRARQTLMTPL